MKRNFKLFKQFCLVCTMLLCVNTFAQSGTSTGTVTGSDGSPLPGTSVLVKGSANGTQTDFDGHYTLTTEKGDILVFSYVGFSTKTIKIINFKTLNVVLAEDANVLNEVVITGYGSQKRNTLATSVAKLDNQVLESATTSNVGTALQGTVAGVQVTQTTGQPGSTPTIVIRGGTSFNGGGSPLVLIDGVPGSFYALNSDDIESMEVLKDAASTAIYGAQGANGVVLIKTKQGKVGKSNISFTTRYSINNERATPSYVSAGDFIKYNRQGILNYQQVTGNTNKFGSFIHGASAFGTGGNTTNSPYTTQYLTADNQYLLDQGWGSVIDPIDPTKTIIFQENDVSDLIYQKATTKDHYLAFDGGNENGTYYLGLGMLDSDGLALGSGFKRYSGKLSATYNILDNLKVSTNVTYVHSRITDSPLGDDNIIFQRFSGQALTSRTYNHNADGTLSHVLNPGTNHNFGNPLYYIDKINQRKNLQQRLTTSVKVDWDIIENLKFSVTASHQATNDHKEAFDKAFLSGGSLKTGRESFAKLKRIQQNQVTGILNYKKTIAEKHNFDAMLGGEYFKKNLFSFSATTKNSPSDLISTMNAGSEASGTPYSFETEYAMVSQFGILNYNFDQRFLVGLSVRRDGSSLLGNNKYGIFPGASVGWNLHNESFFSDSKVSEYINNIKPRISYGVNGNVKSLRKNDSTWDNYNAYGAYSDQGIYDGQTGYANSIVPVLDLLWERSTTLNFGLDLGVLDNRVTILADYFVRDVYDKIADLTLPYYTGFSSIRTNNGILRNKGIELQVTAEAIRTENFSWNLGATFYSVKNYVVELPDNDNKNNRQQGTQIFDAATGETKWVKAYEEGKEVGIYDVVAYIHDYVYADQAAVDAHEGRYDEKAKNKTTRFPGDVAWKDLNGDNIINELDRKVIGSEIPDFSGGLTSNLRYKDFGLFIKTDFAVGHLIRNNMREKGLAQTQGNLNAFSELLDSWTPENTNTNVPRMTFVDPQKNFSRGSSAMWEKGDYLALREVTLSYNLPKGTINGINRLRLYFTGSNLAYFTDYSGDTPEKGGFKGGKFPTPVTYTLGLNITL
ncbi:MAG: SusC/RagA family TonB-linked outer membrane protein [Flavobacteriaceae bacterium]|nr:MAG: SusC/RagA family TonB-linked outer membrane protein [Flavobacteriaceae bacterium]